MKKNKETVRGGKEKSYSAGDKNKKEKGVAPKAKPDKKPMYLQEKGIARAESKALAPVHGGVKLSMYDKHGTDARSVKRPAISKQELPVANVSSKEHSYLGHFRKDKYLKQGHNDSGKMPYGNIPLDLGNVSGNTYGKDPIGKVCGTKKNGSIVCTRDFDSLEEALKED